MADNVSVAVPKTLEEFDEALGRAIQFKEAQMRGEGPIDDSLPEAPPGFYAQKAQIWRAYFQEELQGLARIAQQAEGLDDDRARDSLEPGFRGNVHEFRAFFESAEPPYLSQVIKAGMALEGEGFQNFLGLLQQLSK